MSPQAATPVSGYKRFFQIYLVILAVIFVVRVMLVPSMAQSTTDEKVLEDTVPKHLPIKVKLKKEKEKAFKDMKNEKWLRDFELEVTNTGDKAIYSLSFGLELPEIKFSDGLTVGFEVHYGRMRDINSKPGLDDVPIKPGETYVFSLAYKQDAWDAFKPEENWPQPKKVVLYFQTLWFGDGTGFENTDGAPMPQKQNRQSRIDACKPPPDESKAGRRQEQRAALGSWADTFEMNFLPASFSPVKFLSAESSQTDSFNLLSQPQDCCSGSGCWFTTRYFEDSCYGCTTKERFQWFRYRAKVLDSKQGQAGRWAWDVFLHRAP
ncbi:MAG TPA: hypothetical protein VGC87_00505 [Pyrinomonadaceae bacterium]|jgi:hypothetical protein